MAGEIGFDNQENELLHVGFEGGQFEDNMEAAVDSERTIDMRGILVDLSEAKSKMYFDRSAHYSIGPMGLSCFKLQSTEFRKEISRFQKDESVLFDKILQEIEENADIHKYLVSEGKFPDADTLKEIILKMHDMNDDVADNVVRRIEVFMRHSVDIDVVLLTLKSKMLKRAEKDHVKPEEVEKMFAIIESDKLVQDEFLKLLSIDVDLNKIVSGRSNMGFLVEGFVDLMSKIAGVDPKRGGKVLEKMFIDYDNQDQGDLYKSLIRSTIVEDSLRLHGMFDGYKDYRFLRVGQQAVHVDRAKKMEAIRFLIGIEKLQDEKLCFDLPKVNEYLLGNDGSHAISSYGVVEWGVDYKEISETRGDWIFNIQTDKDSGLSCGVWVDAWVTQAHERAHISFHDLFRKVFSDKYLDVSFMQNLVPCVHDWRSETLPQVGKVKLSTYSSKMINALSEGWTIHHELLAQDFLADNKELFGDQIDSAQVEILRKMRQARFDNDRLVDNHYWLGYQVVSSVFRDGSGIALDDEVFLDDNKKVVGEWKKGLEAVQVFLLKLDMAKLSDPNSRRLFETTRFEEDIDAPEVRRKVWVEDGEKMRLVWQMDKKNTLLDYMTSTDSEKRKKGQEKFLELFGKQKPHL